MKQIGYVNRFEKDKAIIQVKRSSACGAACEKCASNCQVPSMEIKLDHPQNALKVGQYVEIEMRTQKVVKAAFLIYILPLFFMFLGILMGSYLSTKWHLGKNEIYGLISGLIFLGLTFYVIHKLEYKFKAEFNITKIM